MGGGWQAGRARPIVDDATRDTMAERSNWKAAARCAAPAATEDPNRTRRRRRHERRQRIRRLLRRSIPTPGSGTRKGAIVLAVLIVTSLVLYIVGDRLTPCTSQARIQAFVVPVAAEVAGNVVKVHIRDNDEVQPGQPLFDIDPQPYEIALQSARASYATARDSVDAAHAGVEGARAALKAAEANRDMAESDAERQERLYKEDPGAISVRRLEIAQATREEARSKVRGRRGRAASGAWRRPAKPVTTNAQIKSRARRARQGRARLSRTPACSPRRAAWSPTCAPTSAISFSPARR